MANTVLMSDPSAAIAESKHFLLPGEMLFADSPTSVKTVLGSCVAITMRDPHRGLAAVVHCLLPLAGDRAALLPKSEASKYVDSAVEILLNEFARRGIRGTDLEVKLFGGADNLNGAGDVVGYGVGRSNAATALAVLASHGILPAACDTGGECGRVVEFQTGTGDVFVKRLRSLAESRVMSESIKEEL
jgi:chemotaxis protein CheD